MRRFFNSIWLLVFLCIFGISSTLQREHSSVYALRDGQNDNPKLYLPIVRRVDPPILTSPKLIHRTKNLFAYSETQLDANGIAHIVFVEHNSNQERSPNKVIYLRIKNGEELLRFVFSDPNRAVGHAELSIDDNQNAHLYFRSCLGDLSNWTSCVIKKTIIKQNHNGVAPTTVDLVKNNVNDAARLPSGLILYKDIAYYTYSPNPLRIQKISPTIEKEININVVNDANLGATRTRFVIAPNGSLHFLIQFASVPSPIYGWIKDGRLMSSTSISGFGYELRLTDTGLIRAVTFGNVAPNAWAYVYDFDQFGTLTKQKTVTLTQNSEINPSAHFIASIDGNEDFPDFIFSNPGGALMCLKGSNKAIEIDRSEITTAVQSAGYQTYILPAWTSNFTQTGQASSLLMLIAVNEKGCFKGLCSESIVKGVAFSLNCEKPKNYTPIEINTRTNHPPAFAQNGSKILMLIPNPNVGLYEIHTP